MLHTPRQIPAVSGTMLSGNELARLATRPPHERSEVAGKVWNSDGRLTPAFQALVLMPIDGSSKEIMNVEQQMGALGVSREKDLAAAKQVLRGRLQTLHSPCSAQLTFADSQMPSENESSSDTPVLSSGLSVKGRLSHPELAKLVNKARLERFELAPYAWTRKGRLLKDYQDVALAVDHTGKQIMTEAQVSVALRKKGGARAALRANDPLFHDTRPQSPSDTFTLKPIAEENTFGIPDIALNQTSSGAPGVYVSQLPNHQSTKMITKFDAENERYQIHLEGIETHPSLDDDNKRKRRKLADNLHATNKSNIRKEFGVNLGAQIRATIPPHSGSTIHGTDEFSPSLDKSDHREVAQSFETYHQSVLGRKKEVVGLSSGNINSGGKPTGRDLEWIKLAKHRPVRDRYHGNADNGIVGAPHVFTKTGSYLRSGYEYLLYLVDEATGESYFTPHQRLALVPNYHPLKEIQASSIPTANLHGNPQSSSVVESPATSNDPPTTTSDTAE